jgi:uncharacterized heparinase superfamily protein
MALAPAQPGLGTFWRTVRHLRAEQVWGRVWFRLQRPRADLAAAPPLRPATGTWVLPARRGPSMTGPASLRFLNVERTLDGGWDDPQVDRLWRYNLHYFDDLNAEGAQLRQHWHRALLARWIADNPPGRGTGWEPYPVSLRSVNWIKWFLAGTAVDARWRHTLAVQLRWLNKRLEWHLLGNHLFANAKALVMAGLFFAGPEADAWLARGLSILQRELPEQILPDGGQFERSPMYHALALEDLLDLLNIVIARAPRGSAAAGLVAQLRQTASCMLRWLRCMTHASGRLARFNDTADGVAPPNHELERYAAALAISAPPVGDGTSLLADSGYVRCQAGTALLLADVAPLGPDYLLGHAHADTLSFELSLGPRDLVVNGGTSCYGVGRQRQIERGTAAHSTVEVAGIDSSEVWSGFRVGRRARPLDLQVADGKISCAHDGYRHLAGAPLHRRNWHMARGMLRVEDRLQPAGHHAVARFPLAPGLELRADSARRWTVLDGETSVAEVEVSAGDGMIVETRHAGGFGMLLPNQTLAVALHEGHASTCWRWTADAHPLPD